MQEDFVMLSLFKFFLFLFVLFEGGTFLLMIVNINPQQTKEFFGKLVIWFVCVPCALWLTTQFTEWVLRKLKVNAFRSDK